MPDYSKKTVAELQEILKGRSLPHTGKKAELVARLNEADKSVEAKTGMFSLRRIQESWSYVNATSTAFPIPVAVLIANLLKDESATATTKPAPEANVKDAAPIAKPASAELAPQEPAATTATTGTLHSPFALTGLVVTPFSSCRCF